MYKLGFFVAQWSMGVLSVGARALDFLRKMFNLDQRDLSIKQLKMSNSHLFTIMFKLSTIIVIHLTFISQGRKYWMQIEELLESDLLF